MSTQYKLIQDYEGSLFQNYELTDLFLLEKKGRKKKHNENMALKQLLRDKLSEYGIFLLGHGIYVGDMIFRAVTIEKDFPIANEKLIHQMYGYDNIDVNIHLTACDDYAISFDYNTTTKKCRLKKHVFGPITANFTYASLVDMLKDINERTYEEIFATENQIA